MLALPLTDEPPGMLIFTWTPHSSNQERLAWFEGSTLIKLALALYDWISPQTLLSKAYWSEFHYMTLRNKEQGGLSMYIYIYSYTNILYHPFLNCTPTNRPLVSIMDWPDGVTFFTVCKGQNVLKHLALGFRSPSGIYSVLNIYRVQYGSKETRIGEGGI